MSDLGRGVLEIATSRPIAGTASAVATGAGAAKVWGYITTTIGEIGMIAGVVLAVMSIVLHLKKMRNLDQEYEQRRAEMED